MTKEKSDQNAVAELTREGLYKENKWLWEENRDLVGKIEKLLWEKIKLREENKTLKEFKTKREESMFYFKAQMERAEPKTAREAEDLQRAKEIFEGLYRKELSRLEEENKKLKEKIDELEKCNLNLQERLDRKEELNKSYRKELKDHQLYEEKLEHRIIEFEELLHGE